MTIAFVWQGVSDSRTFNQWNDGLREALRYLAETHEIRFFEPWDDIQGDIILYWEAPITTQGANAKYYNRVRKLPIKKALLFAGGRIETEWVEGFDHIFVESKINAEECQQLGLPYSVAFGINDRIFRPESQPKIFDGIHQGTGASWKRQWLVAEALGDKAVLCGRYQESDPKPFDEARKLGTLVLPELPAEAVCSLLNASHTMVQTSDYWGGGQRATLEAMACNVPVICMEDSPKNREYVEESGFGEVVHSSKEQIRDAVERLKASSLTGGREYIESKWTAKHYADAIQTVITL